MATSLYGDQKGYSGHGAQLYAFDGATWAYPGDGTNAANIAPETLNRALNEWRRVARTRDLSGPSLSTNDIDITSNDSPEHFKEYIAGLIDPGELTFDVIFDPGIAAGTAYVSHVGDDDSLIAFLKDRLTRHWRLVLPIQGSTAGIYEITPDPARTAPTNFDSTLDTWLQFDGYVKDFGFETAMEDAIMASMGVRITGNVFIV